MSFLPSLTCATCGADVVVRVTTTFREVDGYNTGGLVEAEEVTVFCAGPSRHPFGRGLYKSHEVFNRWVQRYCPEWRTNYDRMRKAVDAELGRGGRP